MNDIKELSNLLKCHIRSSFLISSVTECLKELISNSLDAKSTKIHIITDIERGYIKLIDNGMGIPKNSLKLITNRYYSSKCSQDNLQSCYGYRGEALASIRCLCKNLIIETHTIKDHYRLIFLGDSKNDIIKSTKIKTSTSGTCIIVDKLFYNLPVRESILSQNNEIESICQLIVSFSLIYPKVTFNYKDVQYEYSICDFPCDNDVRSRISYIFGNGKANLLAPFEIRLTHIIFSGLVSIYPVDDSSLQYIYLNKKWLEKGPLYNYFNKIIKLALINNNKSKDLNTSFIINIKFKKYEWDLIEANIIIESMLQDKFNEIIKKSVRKLNSNFLNNIDNSDIDNVIDKILQPLQDINDEDLLNYLIPLENDQIDKFTSLKTKNNISQFNISESNLWDDTFSDEFLLKALDNCIQDPDIFGSQKMDISSQDVGIKRSALMPLMVSRRKKYLKLPKLEKEINSDSYESSFINMALINFIKNNFGSNYVFNSTSNSINFIKSDFHKMKLINQIEKKFIACIVAQNDGDYICLLDQHAAHERIRLELFTRNAYSGESDLKSTSLKICLRFPLKINDVLLLQNSQHIFSRFGITYTLISENDIKYLMVKTIPTSIYTDHEKKLHSNLNDLINEIKMAHLDGKLISNQLPKTIHNKLASEACHGAIKFGDALSKKQCIELIKELIDCNFPFQCAHGRPSLIPLINLTQYSNKIINKNKSSSISTKLSIKLKSLSVHSGKI